MDSTDKYSLEIEIGDLCKALKTSRPEQYIYTYIKELFPTAIRGKKFDWMNNLEFDIFIPELNLAIEYDGCHWHKKKNSGLIEEEKNNLAKENNITLFRIRERGLNKTSCDYYTYDYNEKYTNIDKAINAIINFINSKYDRNIKTINDFDFNDIKIKTLENLKIQNREQSIIGIWPEVEKYWNYKYNNGIKPENVRPNQKIFLVTTCPYCGKNVEFIPLLSFKRFGKYSFTPHICNALNEYCASLLEQRCTKGKISLSMDNLDDRRLKDWLIRTAKHRENISTIKNIDKLKKLEKKIGFKITCINLYRMDIANLDDLSWR